MEDPSPNGDSSLPDRNPNGRFAVGGRGGPGNPLAKEVAKLRAVLVSQLVGRNASQMRAVWSKMIERAKKGDVAAARLVCEYSIGRPQMAITIEGPMGPAYKVLIGVDDDAL